MTTRTFCESALNAAKSLQRQIERNMTYEQIQLILKGPKPLRNQGCPKAWAVWNINRLVNALERHLERYPAGPLPA